MGIGFTIRPGEPVPRRHALAEYSNDAMTGEWFGRTACGFAVGSRAGDRFCATLSDVPGSDAAVSTFIPCVFCTGVWARRQRAARAVERRAAAAATPFGSGLARIGMLIGMAATNESLKRAMAPYLDGVLGQDVTPGMLKKAILDACARVGIEL